VSSALTSQSRLAASASYEKFDDFVATPLTLKKLPLTPSTSGEEARKTLGLAPSTAEPLEVVEIHLAGSHA
jgi:hypothetical protein